MKHQFKPFIGLMIIFVSGLYLSSHLAADGFQPKRSLDFAAGYAFTYKDDFGGAGAAPSAMLVLSYYISPDSAIGIHLLRWNYHFVGNPQLMTFGYGFSIRHWWPSEWAKLDPFKPYIGYGILLNQMFQLLPESKRSATNIWADGHAIAHDTRIALGTDILVSDQFRLTLEGDWDSSSYPAFGSTSAPSLNFISAFVGCRLLF